MTHRRRTSHPLESGSAQADGNSWPHGARLTIRLLGPVAVEIDGRPLAVDTRKAIALLAYLAITDRPAPRDSLAALLWPDSPEAAARGALRRTLSVLNAALGGVALAVDRSTVALRPDETDADAWRFRDALARVRRHGHGRDDACAACLTVLTEAVSLDRGGFMAGFSLRDSDAFDDWQRTAGGAHQRELSGALERLARGRAVAKEWDAALAAGRRWLELDPLHEPAHRLLMTVLARSGEPGAAIRQFRECVGVLDTELGVAPLDETSELYEAIRAGRLASQGGAAHDETGGPAAPASAVPIGLPLVGRDAQLSALLGAYDAVGPDGRLLAIEGEPGIGKTRLAATLAERLRARGAVVLEARAYAGEESIAFAPIAGLIRTALERPGIDERFVKVRPDLLAAADRLVPLPGGPTGANPGPAHESVPTADALLDPFGRTRLFEGLIEVLTRLADGRVPGVLSIDDLDWADASSVDVIAYLARRLGGRPLAIVATWRPLAPTDEARNRLLAAAERDGLAVSVVLDRLGPADAATLARIALGERASDQQVDELVAESEGLPLYLAEALTAEPPGRSRIPGGVLALLRTRIATVTDVAGQILAAGAVIGRSFDFETVRAASGRSEDEAIVGLEELVQRGLVREVGTSDGDVRFDFTHGRLRDVAYESLGLVRRRLLHRRVAEALAARPASQGEAGARLARIALHEALAGRTSEAAEAHRGAGEHARSIHANVEAREHLEAALASGHTAKGEIHESLGEVLTLLGDYSRAIAHLEAAAAIRQPGREWAIEHRLALVHARLGDWTRAASHASAAIEGAPDEPGIRSALLADQSAIAGRSGDITNAEALATEALELAERDGDPAGVARACQVLGVLARDRGDLSAARRLLERAVGESEHTADGGLRVAALNALALLLADNERELAMALTREALERCQRLGDRHRQAALENNLADLLRAAGRREEAMDHLKRAVKLFSEVVGRPGELEPEIWKLVEW